jgi:meckelin
LYCTVLLLQVSVYWLVLYKLQEGVLLLMLPDDQLYNFWVTVVLAMVGQSVGLLQMLYQQIRCVPGTVGHDKAWRGTSR